MGRVNELAPRVGTGIACAALGVWRGAPARERVRVHRASLCGPPRPRSARARPPLALSAQESQALLATLNSERSAGGVTPTALAPIYEKELPPAAYVINGQQLIGVNVVK